MVKNMPRTQTNTHEKDTTLRCCTNLNRLIQTTFEIARHYTTLRPLPTWSHLHCVGSWASPVASEVCRLSCFPLDHDRCLSESAKASLVIFSIDTKVYKEALELEESMFEIFWKVLPSIWRHSIQPPLKGFLFSPNRTSLCPKSRA